MSEANNQARLLEQLTALASRAAYVCAHDYEAHKPVGTRLLAISDLKAEYNRTAQLLKEIQESGGSEPAATKTEEAKHVGISDVFCCHVERAVSALKYRRDALLRDMEGMPKSISKVMDEGRENDVRAIAALEEWLQQNADISDRR